MTAILTHLSMLIVAAGVAQLVLVVGSVAIPRVLRWSGELKAVSELTRRLFWAYAGYIWVTNLSFGAISAAAPDALLDGTVLAAAVCGFMAVYWGARLVIQFVLFQAVRPAGGWFRLAEAALVVLFVFLTAVYAAATVSNLQSLGA